MPETEVSVDTSNSPPNRGPDTQQASTFDVAAGQLQADQLFAKTGKTVAVTGENPDPTLQADQVITPQQEIVPPEPELLFHLNNMLTNPGMYTHESAEKTVRDTLAGRDMDTLRQENPALAEALDKLEASQRQQAKTYSVKIAELMSESAADAPPAGSDTKPVISEQEATALLADTNDTEVLEITPANTLSEQITENDEMTLTVKDNKTGKERQVTTKGILFLAAVVAADLLLFGGQNTYIMLEEILGAELSGGLNKVMGKLGFEVPEKMLPRAQALGVVFDKMSPTNLKRLFEDLPKDGTEVFNLLNEMSRDDRERMLAGQYFGGKERKHLFEPKDIEMVLSKLTKRQKEELRIKTETPAQATPPTA